MPKPLALLVGCALLASCAEPVRYIVPDDPVEVVTIKDLKALEAIAGSKFLLGMQIQQVIPHDDGFLVIFQWNLDAATAQRVELFR